jgi:aminoacyl tRNA synthase complex-interacting multifunctional protein 1
MAAPNAPMTSLISLLHRSFPHAVPSNSTESDIPDLTSKIYPAAAYTSAEKTEITQWLISTQHLVASTNGDPAKQAERLGTLNLHLSTRTSLLGNKPSIADIALYARLAPLVEKWSPEERTGERGYHHIVRHIDFVQNGPVFSLQIPDEEKVKIDVDDVRFVRKPVDAKEEKERKKKKKKKEKAAVACTEVVVDSHSKPSDQPSKSKKEKAKEKVQELKDTLKGSAPVAAATDAPQTQKPKKEKAPKQPKQQPAAKETPLSPSLIDLRVSHILKAIPHPNADSLYISTISCGDAPGTENTSISETDGKTVVRTVCSGLNGLIPLKEMQGRHVVTVCNLKPVTMRGIKSAAMVLAASPRPKEGEEDAHGKGPVELVDPPDGAETGERVFFEGWENGEPEKVLNPKKKVWETIQPGFTTTEDGEVAFDVVAVPQLTGEGSESARKGSGLGKLVTKKGGVCTVKSLKWATVR